MINKDSSKGTGQSKLAQEDSVYKSKLIQKVSIVHDFLNYILPNRSKYAPLV